MEQFTITSTSGSDLGFIQIIKFPGPMKQLTIYHDEDRKQMKFFKINWWNRTGGIDFLRKPNR